MQNFRLRLREILDRLQEKWLQWKASHPGWIRAYTVFSMVSLLVFLLSLFFFEDARKIFVQFLWSLYLLWQFWILARSKTFTWKTYSAFFLVGAWVIPFITQGFVAIIHLLFGGEPSDWWSIAVVTPIVEEIFKLLPLFVYLWLSRRATALSLSDYALIGAAVGGGFQMMEEVARRLASGKIWGYGFSIWDGQVIHWEFFDLFPGYFESSYFATEMMSGHAVITALTALGVGLGIRWRRKGGRAFLLVPLFLLFWAVLDHAVWNDSGGDLPEWINKLHDALGSGYYAEPALLILLALGIFLDYRDMNRIGDRLPRLPGERVIHPFGELRHLFWAFLADPRLLAQSLLFVQDRKQLAFSLLGAETVFDKGYKRKREEALSRGLDRHREQMLAIIGTFALLGLVLTVVIAGAAASAETACFACLFDSLANWWEGLDGWEQGLIFLGALALGWWLFGGLQLAFTILTTLISIAENGHAIARFLRNPLAETRTWWNQWSRLTPAQRLQVAASTLLSAALHRFGGAAIKKTIRFAKRHYNSVFRADNDFYSKTRPSQSGKTEIPKAHLDEMGNLIPANPNGRASITEHILNINKHDSPYISTTSEQGISKRYGKQRIQIDLDKLQEAISKGEVQAEIIGQDRIIQELKQSLEMKKQELNQLIQRENYSKRRYDKLIESIIKLENAIENTRRDKEILIKGIVPNRFISGPENLN
ncbi:Membrane proteinase PrsW, cleaves anti-sigma factor RsiW, M82 family [Planifilum fulgidum]|uniref:Membrane proteinase PrsW, cleaves anti-sigma factor RsiW, M82 family n=1 Tax=Planifilum fulgidum TaxID=201973 RepID=A0A1I2LTA0_9BACL|nr:PrsW family glutamic-type intramembrane protease [Planifilum fulgidum]SFF82465.1 Membrane proteinase PrsW, cleaves anti-sigma factor RsiW, M82 family [Planifilum fulgidum]